MNCSTLPTRALARLRRFSSQSALAGLDAAQQISFRASNEPPGIARLRARYADIPVERIRNFSIVAHIDHGKSTLADKLLESVENIWPTTRGRQQVLDTLEVERTRGITVKAQSASLLWRHPESGEEYLFNLIDTPGHVDFAYEVSRALAACQGALLLVDCAQGVQAQTVANHKAAVDAGLALVPLLTKIDLPTADPEPALAALDSIFGFDQDSVIWTSAKTGAGISEIFPAIIARIPPPGASSLRAEPLRALLIDAWHDAHRGVVCLVQVASGILRSGETLYSANSGDSFLVQEAGLLAPGRVPIVSVPNASDAVLADVAAGRVPSARGALGAGNVGYLYTNMKSVRQARVGDTFIHAGSSAAALPGFRPSKPMVFASLYPIDSGDFNALALAVDRLTLNDASVAIERESSGALGFGLRCGFLGLLHMDVFVERLQQEFSAECIVTAPMVGYKVIDLKGVERIIERPGDFPDAHLIASVEEPMAHVSIMAPAPFLSALFNVLIARRGVQEDVIFINNSGAGAADAAVLAAASAAAEASAAEVAVSADVVETEADADADDDEEEEKEENASSDSENDTRLRAGRGSGGSFNGVVLTSDRVILKFVVPWAEIVSGFYDEVKSVTAGYASVDWLPGDFAPVRASKVDILLNGKPLDALCFVTHHSKAVAEGRRVALKLKKEISRQQFEIVIQASIGSKIICKERIPPFRKDVLIKSGKTVGGGDVSRKQKLLSKQREGKRRMKTVGNITLSQTAFHAVLTK